MSLDPHSASDQLRKLSEASPCARAMLRHFAEYKQDRSEVTLDRLEDVVRNSNGERFPRAELILVLRRLGEAGVGRFIIGRRGGETRFEPAVPFAEIGAAAVPVSPDSEEAAPRLAAVAGALPSADIEHRFALRPGVGLTLSLPGDLTQGEANRLADFVRTLPFIRT